MCLFVIGLVELCLLLSHKVSPRFTHAGQIRQFVRLRLSQSVGRSSQSDQIKRSKWVEAQMVVNFPWKAAANHTSSQLSEWQPTALLASRLSDTLGILGKGSKFAQCQDDLWHSRFAVFVLLRWRTTDAAEARRRSLLLTDYI